MTRFAQDSPLVNDHRVRSQDDSIDSRGRPGLLRGDPLHVDAWWLIRMP